MIRRALHLGLALCTSLQSAAAIEFTITSLTANNFLDADPQVSGPYVVWWNTDGAAADREIMRYYHFTQTATPLTTNSFIDVDPQVSGFFTTWWGEPDPMLTGVEGREIFFHDGTSSTRVTTNTIFDRPPQISGTNVVWGQGVNQTTTRQIMKYDGSTVVPLTTSGFNDSPQISGDNVVYGSGTVPNRNIILHDGTGPTQLTPLLNDQKTKDDPAISGGIAVWEGFVGNTANDREIFAHDGNDMSIITSNSFGDHDPQISGTQLVWWGGTFNNFQVYHIDGGAQSPMVVPLSTGALKQLPQISGNNVVWQGKATLADDFEIFFWDGNTVTQITDNDYDDTKPQIAGFNVVWEAHEAGDTEIHFAQANLLAGDGNVNGNVEAADYTIWADEFGQFHGNATILDGDYNGDGLVDAADYTVWADNFGMMMGGDGPVLVPEPSAWVLLAIAIVSVAVNRRRLV